MIHNLPTPLDLSAFQFPHWLPQVPSQQGPPEYSQQTQCHQSSSFHVYPPGSPHSTHPSQPSPAISGPPLSTAHPQWPPQHRHTTVLKTHEWCWSVSAGPKCRLLPADPQELQDKKDQRGIFHGRTKGIGVRWLPWNALRNTHKSLKDATALGSECERGVVKRKSEPGCNVQVSVFWIKWNTIVGLLYGWMLVSLTMWSVLVGCCIFVCQN